MLIDISSAISSFNDLLDPPAMSYRIDYFILLVDAPAGKDSIMDYLIDSFIMDSPMTDSLKFESPAID